MLRALVLLIAMALSLEVMPSSAATSRFSQPPAGGADGLKFECGGAVESQVWAIWDSSVKTYIDETLLRSRLLAQGDVYALYDVQSYAHNLVSMARRCQRADRLLEIARIIGKAYDALTPGSIFSPGRRWICRGGSICNTTNKLLNEEVVLDSVQFLGLAFSVANAMATADKPLEPDERDFIQQTVEIGAEHLTRWGSDVAISKLNKSAKAKPQDVIDGSSALLFTDKQLWMITVYAELAGIAATPAIRSTTLSPQSKSQMKRHLAALLQFFEARISVSRMTASRIGDVDIADIDRGYWKLFADNRYAGYTGEAKPVTCAPGESSQPDRHTKFNIAPESVPLRQDVGWDFSHARRLVPALDALQRNGAAMHDVFGFAIQDLPASDAPMMFANNLAAVVWNGDPGRPLFSNYWNGANGWYRVAYDNGTGQCQEGYPPFGLTDSFVTGGYITWSKYRPEIGLLGKQIYMLADDQDSDASLFLQRYYPDLSAKADQQAKALAKLMFLPTLVSVDIEPEK